MSTDALPPHSSQPVAATQQLSLLQGPLEPPLVDLTLGELLELQSDQYGSRECLVIPWTGARWTYGELDRQSSLLARALLAMGIRAGDRVGIMAGNCEQYAAVFFGAARVGAVLVILNNTYTATEALHGLKFTGCRVLFTTRTIGRLDNGPLLEALARQHKEQGQEQEQEQAPPRVVMLRGGEKEKDQEEYETYEGLTRAAAAGVDVGAGDEDALRRATRRVSAHQVVNLQFTSGTTGLPKAAMLTHHNLVNNARFVGDRMGLGPDDVLCCPPPLFHCFGLVLGLLAVLTHGGKIVYPAEVFDAAATLRAVSDERCTALHGVPAMFDSLLQVASSETMKMAGPSSTPQQPRLRTGIIAGAPVPRRLMEQLVRRLGMTELTSSYGLTEASPTCFNAFAEDPVQRRLTTVGTLMPHARAKIVDRRGRVVPRGCRGELCIAGYQLQAGYWDNPDKTAEVMVRDEDGVLWLHTGDEAVFDDEGYCSITGRFKDMIIR
ncbi:hypothetical protein E4U41_001186, partial [Claviceps citrina]